jgi:hypothetical protein
MIVVAGTLVSEPLDALRQLAVTQAELDRLRRTTVSAARIGGATWHQIGEALGTTRVSAWQSFTLDTRVALTRNVANNTDLSEVEAMELAVEEVSASRSARRRVMRSRQRSSAAP